MLVLIAVLTVWVPRRVGSMIDGLVAGRLTGATLWCELAILIAMGVAIDSRCASSASPRLA